MTSPGRIAGFKATVAALAALLALAGISHTAAAQVATNMYGQAVLVAPGTSGPVVGGTGPQGTATFEQSETGGSRITVSLAGMQPGSTLAVTIEDNSCDGPVRYTLNSVSAGSDGAGTSVTEISDMIHTGSSYVSVRESAAGAAMLLCGNVHVIMTAGGGVNPGTPGMPSTGNPWDSLVLAFVLVAALLIVSSGLLLRAAKRRA